MRYLILLLSLATWTAGATTVYQYEIIERVDHDPGVFTQGLVLRDGWFYQSSGLYGKSFLLRYPADSAGEGDVKKLEVPPNIFAEGITVVNEDLFLLSWKAGTGWRFDAKTFQLQQTFHYGGEGWGLTDDGKRLILSDGTSTIKFISPQDFSTQSKISVTLAGNPVSNLNELEYVNGVIWANQWQSTTLFGIDPSNGNVLHNVDISALQKEAGVSEFDSVANGIAYDAERDLFWLTGKYWKYRYLVKLSPSDAKNSQQ
jgi:glutaminyl-peptide cyclotransferase